MAGFGDAIKYLYTQFILRDVLSFITPGAIVVLTATHLFFPRVFSLYIPWPFYVLLFGAFYIVGFAIQCFGEFIGFVRIHLLAIGCFKQRFKIFCCNWDNESTIWWRDAHEDMVSFSEITSDKEWAQLQQERLVVLKQMCANAFLAIAIAGIFLGLSFCEWTWVKVCIGIIVTLVLLASLFWGYRVHELRLDTMRRAIRHLPINGKQES